MKSPEFSVPRHDPRIHVGLPVRMRFGWKGSEEIEASIIDISERGLHVRCHAPLLLGSEVEVVFEGAADKAKPYHVVWVRETESTQQIFEIGLQLKSVEAPCTENSAGHSN